MTDSDHDSPIDLDFDRDLESAVEEKWTRAPDKRSTTAYLDGLRGLACLLVYNSHLAPWWYGIETTLHDGFGYHGQYSLGTFPFIRSLFTGGAAGVALFFVMSGYVLSVSPLNMLKDGNAKDARWYLLTASIRRPFRLFLPVAAISLIFACWMQLPFGLSPHLDWPQPQPSFFAEMWKWIHEFGWAMNIFVAHGVFAHWFCYDPPAWSMAAELKGSWVVFGLLALSSISTLKPRLGGFFAVGVLCLMFYQWELACFMFGVVLAILKVDEIDILQNLSSKWKHAINHLAFFAGWYLLGQPHGKRDAEISHGTPGWYYLTMAVPLIYYQSEFWRFWNTIGATLLLYGVINIQWIQSLLVRPTLRYLGKVSFSLYLIHIPIAWTVADRVARILGVVRQDFTTPWDEWIKMPDLGPTGFSTGYLLWQAIVLPFNLFLASIATKRIDEPSVKVGKWLTSKLLPTR